MDALLLPIHHLAALVGQSRQLLGLAPLTAPERRKCLGKWFGSAHDFAARAEAALDSHGDLLGPVLPYGPAALAAQRQRVLLLERAEHEIAALHQEAKDTLLLERARLYQMSAGVLDGLAWLCAQPLRPDAGALRARLAGTLRGLRRERDRRNQKISHSKRARAIAPLGPASGLGGPAAPPLSGAGGRSAAKKGLKAAQPAPHSDPAVQVAVQHMVVVSGPPPACAPPLTLEGKLHGQGDEPHGRGPRSPAPGPTHDAAHGGGPGAECGGPAPPAAGGDGAGVAAGARLGQLPLRGPRVRGPAARGRGGLVPGGAGVCGARGPVARGARRPLPREPVPGPGPALPAPAAPRAGAGAGRGAGLHGGGGPDAQGGAGGPAVPGRHARGGAGPAGAPAPHRRGAARRPGARRGLPAQGVARPRGEEAGQPEEDSARAGGAR